MEESFEIKTSSNKYYDKRFWKKDRINNKYQEMLHRLELSQLLRTKEK